MSFEPSENPITNPTRESYTELRPFRFWCQKVLPLVYDDSLSYYELLCKVVDYLNKTMEDVDHMNTDMDTLYSNFQSFQEGTFRIYNELVDYVNTYFDELDVQEEINNKLDDMVTSGELVAILQPSIATEVSNWLDEHITPTSPAIDNTLLVSGAGADAKVTGDLFKFTKSNIWNYVDSINNQYLFLDDLNITGKYINPSDGALNDYNNAICGYISIPSSGHYKTFQPPFFGSNAKYIPLYDANKTFIKAIEGEINENGIVSFTITDNDFINGCYIGLTHILNQNAPKLIKGNDYGSSTYTQPILNLKNNNAIIYKGLCDSNLNSVIESGYYLIPSNAEHLPDDYPATAGLLVVFEPALNTDYIIQFLTSPVPSTPTYHRYLKIDGSDISNWTKNITTADNIFSYKGVCNTNLNTVVKAGWYILPQNATPLPQNYNNLTGILRVYQPAYSNNYVLQIITNVDKGTTMYHRYLNVDGTDVREWTMEINELNYNPTLHKIYAGLNKENLFMFSTNANYFNTDDATWHDGLYRNGSVTGGLPYQYCYVPLQGTGVYYKSEKYLTFGDNTLKFYLCDKDKNYITFKECNRISNNLVSVTLSDTDLTNAFYTVIVRSANDTDFYNRLLYNPVRTPSDNSSYNEIPNYGFISDLLYNKNLICTGDSIADANSDLPQNRDGWFGRLQTKYMMNGANYAVGGGSITYISSDRYCISRGIDVIHSDYPNIDYLILEGGTNDADLIGQFSGDTPPQNFGTWSATDYSGTYDDTTFCGAVESMFYKSVNYWPNAHIGFIVAMEMGSGNSSINRKRYFDEIIKIAEKWHIPVLNLWDNSGADSRLIVFYDPNKTNAENIELKKFYVDGQHPSSYGYNKMQTMIENWVRSL